MIDFILEIINIKQLDEDEHEHARQLAFIYNFIKSKFWMLTIEEVKEAFRMYVANQFDIKVFRMIDCVVVGQVLHAYIEFRNGALATYVPKDNTPKLEVITNSAKEEINKRAVNRIFDDFKESKYIPEGVTYVYDTLVEYGLIKVASESTPKLKAYYDVKMKEAVKELKREKQIEIKDHGKNGLDVIGVNSLKNALSDIENGNCPAIIIRTKKIVLKEFFISKILDGQKKIFEL